MAEDIDGTTGPGGTKPPTPPPGTPGPLVIGGCLALAVAGLGRAVGRLVGSGPIAVLGDSLGDIATFAGLAVLTYEGFRLAREAVEQLGRAAASAPGASEAKPPSPFADQIAEANQAIDAADWAEATRHAAELRDLPEPDADVERFLRSWERRRQRAASELEQGLPLARTAQDPDRLLEARAALAELDPGTDRAEEDRAAAKWLVGVIQRRMVAGAVDESVVELAERAASVYGGTVEGASLSASLPTLRQSVQLRRQAEEDRERRRQGEDG